MLLVMFCSGRIELLSPCRSLPVSTSALQQANALDFQMGKLEQNGCPQGIIGARIRAMNADVERDCSTGGLADIRSESSDDSFCSAVEDLAEISSPSRVHGVDTDGVGPPLEGGT